MAIMECYSHIMLAKSQWRLLVYTVRPKCRVHTHISQNYYVFSLGSKYPNNIKVKTPF